MIWFTLDGILICVREVQLAKAKEPIISTPVGMMTEGREEQPKKAFSSISFTLFGITTDFSDLHS